MSLRDNNGRRLYVLTPNTLRSETAAAASKLVFFEYNGLHLPTQILGKEIRRGSSLFARDGKRRSRGGLFRRRWSGRRRGAGRDAGGP